MQEPPSDQARTTLRYREYVPAPALRSHVECLWVVWDSVRRTNRPPDRVVPDGCPELIFHLGGRFSRQQGGRWVRQPGAFLAGTLTRPWLIRAGARLFTLGIRFRPGAVTRWLDIDMKQVVDREVPLEQLIGQSQSGACMKQLRAARTRGEAIRLAERWLQALSLSKPKAGDDAARAAVRALLASHGGTRMDALATQLGSSPRRLERAFAHSLGIRPKLFARIVRLNAALALLASDQRLAAVDWALAAGYFDQAHLARDFRVVAGRRALSGREADGQLARNFTAPKRLLNYLSGPERAVGFVQSDRSRRG
jgi:AraC-like DNA-binding protein